MAVSSAFQEQILTSHTMSEMRDSYLKDSNEVKKFVDLVNK